ncbi:MAG: HAD family hydrolase [Syntrophobacteraceae bacterium]
MCRTENFQAIILDVDGTLLDTSQDLADSMNSTLRHFGFPIHELQKYKYFVGDGMENLVRRSLPDSAKIGPLLLSQCIEMMRQTYERNWNVKSRPYPGIPELLDALTARGLKMAVLSNKPHDLTRKVIEALLPTWRFEVVMGERPSVPRKPDPSSALEIANRLGVEPAGFLYLGDTATDMKTANAAGMYAVGALWGFRNAEELIESGAKKLIAKPAELLELL